MQVLCIFNEERAIEQKVSDNVYGEYATFDLTINQQYSVYGMAIWRGVLYYLIVDIWGNPTWFSAELFAVIDDEIVDIHFKFYRKDLVRAVWGYKKLLDEEHYDGLINRQQKDLDVFFANKELIDACAIRDLRVAMAPKNVYIAASNCLKDYYTNTIDTEQFAEVLNGWCNTAFINDLPIRDRNDFKDLWQLAQLYISGKNVVEQMKSKAQKLYFLVTFPEGQWKHY